MAANGAHSQRMLPPCDRYLLRKPSRRHPLGGHMPCSRSSTPVLVLGLRLATGSSATMSVGHCASARAMATRCCCPPDSVSARRIAMSSSPTRSRHSNASRRSPRSKRSIHPRHAATYPGARQGGEVNSAVNWMGAAYLTLHHLITIGTANFFASWFILLVVPLLLWYAGLAVDRIVSQ
jgi:hypothetical protein